MSSHSRASGVTVISDNSEMLTEIMTVSFVVAFVVLMLLNVSTLNNKKAHIDSVANSLLFNLTKIPFTP
jgi:hypothetical protein